MTPAAIVLLGPRLDSLDVRRLLRRLLAPPRPGAQAGRAVVLVPIDEVRDAPLGVPIGLVVVALLVLLGLPFLAVKWGFPDDRVLPRSASSHQVGDELRTNFAHDSATAVPVVVPDARGLTPADLDRTPPICRGCPTCRR